MPEPEQESKSPSAAASNTPYSAPSLSLPKGGGAIRGIGEKFSVAAASGTAHLSIPIFTSPGRSNSTPVLSLGYDSGTGTGPFGIGWSLSVPVISRSTAKKLPRYLDSLAGRDSDIFLLSGAEDLVPQPEILRKSIPAEGTYVIRRYRPRIEGLFSRIEKWTHAQSGETHWRSTSRENVTSLYGKSLGARIADPENPTRVFKWLLEETRDDKGHVSRYEYKRENAEAVDRQLLYEQSRLNEGFGNCYLKRVLYGNRLPFQAQDWLFELVLDYGDHHPEIPEPAEDRPWTCRHDSFSTYSSGFEVRTYRLCRRALMFHRFEELGAQPCLVKSTDFEYEEGDIFTFLKSVQQTCYRKKSGADYFRKAMPKVEFSYTKSGIDPEIRALDSQSLENLPSGVDEKKSIWQDLDKEGLAGVLMEEADAWFYKRNLGGAKLSARELITEKPSASLALNTQLMDVAGNSRQYLVSSAKPLSGFWRAEESGWEPFTAFENKVTEPGVLEKKIMIDLDGDGMAEILLEEDQLYSWYPSLGEKGYGPKEFQPKPQDARRQPVLVYTGKCESILTADMSGDGLQDIVRIRNGEISYWPNLGYGRFGSRITMADAPLFDHPDQFDPVRIRLADIDGSGVTDLFYLGRNETRYWFNCAGNGWSEAHSLDTFPDRDPLATVAAVDLLGNGTTCLVSSSPAHGLRYLDLMGGKKPHLLESIKNNLGAETHLDYAPSTRFYLEDREAGRPWITKLPFPVHVVTRVETRDRISRNRFVKRYAYHHGYFDHEEREFRGFGRVDEWDTEELSILKPENSPGAENEDDASYVPPVLTYTWFHTGVYFSGEKISRQYADEYFSEDPGAQLLPDTVIPADLNAEEEREACRALKNALLRQEIYSLDGSAKASLPYSVKEHNYTVKCLQLRGENPHGVFFMHARESVDYYYERKVYDIGGKKMDPRVSHAMTLAVDDFGNVLLSAAISYGRRFEDPDPILTIEDRLDQKRNLIMMTESRFTNAVLEEAAYRTPLACESRTYELLNFVPAANQPQATNLFSWEEMQVKITAVNDGSHDVPYENGNSSSSPPGPPARRLIEHSQVLYRRNDSNGALPLGQLESLALPFESYKLAFTPGLVSAVYGGRVTDALLLNEGKYVHFQNDANAWIPSGQIFYSEEPTHTPTQELTFAQGHFFLPRRYRDAFGNLKRVRYDDYDLLVREIEDALENTITTALDYRVLQPFSLTDPNGNRTVAAFDTWGFVAGLAVMGKTGETKGDSLDGFEPDLDDATLASYYANPLAGAAALLKKATTRFISDLFAYARTQSEAAPQPAVVSTLAREIHESDLPQGQTSRLNLLFSYSDGFGREIQKKAQFESGPLESNDPEVSPRWLTSGWTIFNNKGLPIKKYEPFFSATYRFEFGKIMGVGSLSFYDPMGRVVALLNPNHTFEKIFFDPWRQEKWDVHDTVLIADPKNDPDAGVFFRRLPDSEYLPTWHSQRISGALGEEEKKAASKAAAHANTPNVTHVDSLEREFLTIADNGPAGKERTKTILDIEGNVRAAIDALGRIVMRYDYDMLSHRLRQESMEAGTRWMFHDAGGLLIFSWNSRENNLRSTYDALRRPAQLFLRQGGEAEKLIQKTVYGESQGQAVNHRGKIFESFDGAGKVTYNAYDFKGNVLSSSRQFAADYKNTLNWAAPVSLEPGLFTTTSTYDALNRVVAVTTPDQSVTRSLYNEANFLERVEAHLKGVATATVFVSDIDYNPKGQRTFIQYGNNVRTTYEYDPLTFRMVRAISRRGGESLQDLAYTYDPIGNVTSIRDLAQQTVYFNGAVAEPHTESTYDALYRLISATGREHIGQQAQPQTNWKDEFRIHLPHPNDGQAMRNYTENYQYDPAGNLLRLAHKAANGNWTRDYHYEAASQLEGSFKSNRLTGTQVGNAAENYAYDMHGNMAAMAHLTLMDWGPQDDLWAVSEQAVAGGGTPETTYYVYDAGHRRLRKITESAAPAGASPKRKTERFYLNRFELYREFQADGTTQKFERETLHVSEGEKRLALAETKTSENSLIRFQLGNHLGSANLELDQTGAIISYEEYYPFGSTSFQSGRSAAEVSLKRYRYTGKERDEETGFSYHGARYYAPWLGRWTAADPLGIQDRLNLYAYGKNNPVTFHDPTGTKNEPQNETDKQIMMMTDPQLYRYVKGLSAAGRQTFAAGATGAFANRAWAMLNKYQMEVEIQFADDKIVGKRPAAPRRNQDAKNLKEYWKLNEGKADKRSLRQEWDELHPIDPNEPFSDERTQEIIEEGIIETKAMEPAQTMEDLAEKTLHDAIMPRRGNNQNLDAPLNLNFAAADHFLFAIEMTHSVGWIGARIQIAGYDSVKPLVPATGKQSAPDERVQDWAFKGTDEAQKWKDDIIPECKVNEPTIIDDPVGSGRVEEIQKDRQEREDLRARTKWM